MASINKDFLEELYSESPRGWAELESLRYAAMARLGLNETDALELTCKIVIHGNRPKPAARLNRGPYLEPA